MGSESHFLELTRMFYKCVKGTVMSESLAITSTSLRKLEVGDVLEAVEGPAKEEEVGVQRMKCKAVSDNTIGWVTLAGNQGTAFLAPGGNMYSCVKDTVLTDGLSVSDSKTVRRISKGEVLEVLEFGKRDDSVGVQRVRARAKQDGATGWITV